MKKIIFTAIIAVACVSSHAFAESLPDKVTGGAMTNKAVATATVTIDQPITLTNNLAVLAGIKVPKKAGEYTKIAKGSVAINEAGIIGHIGIMSSDASTNMFQAYADSHDGDDNYMFYYAVLPGDKDVADYLSQGDTFPGYSLYSGADGSYLVTSDEIQSLKYSVIANDIKKAGAYTINTTAAIYVP